MTRRRLAAAAGASALLAGLAPGLAAAARAPRVSVMVTGPKGVTVAAPRTVRARATTVHVAGRRCHVRPATALSVLAGLRRAGGPRFRLHDYGGCSPMFVSAIGRYRNHGVQGWSYKVGHRTPQVAAGLRTGIHFGVRVQWFWCRIGPSGCQRSLATRVSDRTVAPGDPLEVTVRAYDDRGRGRAGAGVTVRLGTAHART